MDPNQKNYETPQNQSVPPVNPIDGQLQGSVLYQTLNGVAREIGKGIETARNQVNAHVNPPRSTYQPPQGGAGPYTPPQPDVTTPPRAPQPPVQPRQQVPPMHNTPPGVRYQSQPYRRPRPVRPYAPPPRGYQKTNTPNYTPPQPNDVTVKVVHERGSSRFWVTGVLAVLLASNMPLYNPFAWIGYAAAVAVTFAVCSKIFKGKKKYVAVPVNKQQPAAAPAAVDQTPKETKKSRTGNPEVDKIIDEGYEYLEALHKANDAIPDAQMSDCIDRIERASAGIFSYISEKPEQAPQIRKFMSYYLPTTMKLLDSYQRLDQQTYKGENIQTTMKDIDRMLYTVANAFEKQLDLLFSEEAMDISTDISVFESMLKQEGFVDNDQAIPQPKSE